jgi:hypothetical protein
MNPAATATPRTTAMTAVPQLTPTVRQPTAPGTSTHPHHAVEIAGQQVVAYIASGRV